MNAPIGIHGLLPELHAIDNAELNARVAEQHDSLMRLLDGVTAARETVESDRGLNGQGRGERLEAITAEARKGIEAMLGDTGSLGKVRVALEAQRARVQKQLDDRLTPRMAAADTAAEIQANANAALMRQLREREIRDRLLAIDPTARLGHVLAAAERNDLEVLRAVVGAPSIAAVLSAEELEMVHDAHIKQHFPEQHRTRHELDAALTTLTFNANVARRVIG